MKEQKIIFNRLVDEEQVVKCVKTHIQDDKNVKFKSNILILTIVLAIINLLFMLIGFYLIQKHLDTQIDLFEHRIDSLILTIINNEKEKLYVNTNNSSNNKMRAKREMDENIINGELEIEIGKPDLLNKYCQRIKDSCMSDLVGPIGPPGKPGYTGLPGIKGDKGAPGFRGEKGEPGWKGDLGEQGLPGPKGDQGIFGIKGNKGEKGIKGEKGEPGWKGDLGEPGWKGYLGEQGSLGIKGDKGEIGLIGAPGIQGLKGDRGDKGEKGESCSTTLVLNDENFNASYRSLKTFDQSMFNGHDMTKIKYLRLNNNKLQTLKTNSFVNFVNAEELYLQQNQINSIEMNSFNGLVNLKILDLSSNMLTNMPTGSFHGLANLKSLNLAGNQIKNADFNNLPFLGLINLISLDLTGNNFHNIFSFTFSNLSKLQILILRLANVQFLDNHAFNNGFGLCLSETKNTNIYLFGNPVIKSNPSIKNDTCYTVYKTDEKIADIKF